MIQLSNGSSLAPQCRARAQRWADKLAEKNQELARGGVEGLSGAPHGQNVLKIPAAKLVLTTILTLDLLIRALTVWCCQDEGFNGKTATENWVNGPELFKSQVSLNSLCLL